MIILKVLGGYSLIKRIICLFIVIMFFNFNINGYCEDINLSGSNYILMDNYSGRVLLEKDSNKTMSMASLTKIMTALIAIEQGDFNKLIRIDKECINVEGSSIYLKENEILTLEDLLYGLMLRSGNDAAVAIAKNIGGSVENFIDMMNGKSKEINIFNTNFKNPHGLSEKEHYSTAYDLAVITREALKYKMFQTIFSTKSYTANRELNNHFTNKNKTLWEYEGGDGGKTGYTIDAGRCLVSTASKNQMQLIAVNLNNRNWFQDNYRLFDYGFENFKPYIIYDKHQSISKMKLPKSNRELHIITESDLIYPLKIDEKDKIKNLIVINKNIKLPIKNGEKIGYIESYFDGKLINKGNLISKDDIFKENIFKRLFSRLN